MANYVFQALAEVTGSDGVTSVAANPTVEVRDSDGNLATIYADRDGNTQYINPSTEPGDSDGRIEFWAAVGQYTVTATKDSESWSWTVYLSEPVETGTGSGQVPTNADLGGMAYEDDADYYTKAETYSQSETDALLDDKADAADLVYPVTATDTLTWHEANQTSVAASSYATVFDLSGAVELVGGAIYSQNGGFRLTVDGTVVADRNSGAGGVASQGGLFYVAVLPPAKSTTSMKLEAYNVSASAEDFGWRVATR